MHGSGTLGTLSSPPRIQARHEAPLTLRRSDPILAAMARTTLLALVCLPAIGACGSAAAPSRGALFSSIPSTPLSVAAATHRSPVPSGAVPVPGEIALAIVSRLAELEERGGVCSVYASVIERSYRQGRIMVRPFMWRVEGRLVSGQATPDGDMVLARDIDALNVGLRTVDDVLRSVEHEAAHIAFRIPNDEWAGQDRADRYVRECRGAARAG